eukprot:862241-Amphidinium_carterae.1
MVAIWSNGLFPVHDPYVMSGSLMRNGVSLVRKKNNSECHRKCRFACTLTHKRSRAKIAALPRFT